VAIHQGSGLRAGFLCWGGGEWFLVGTAPRERCGPDWFARRERPPPREPYEPRRGPPPEPIDRPIERFLGELLDLVEETTRRR
jgi:hypothetical protein